MKEVYINHHKDQIKFEHLYNITEEINPKGYKKTSLVRTGHGWSSHVADKETMSITDDGNQLHVFIDNNGGHSNLLSLDYDVAEELLIMLMQQKFADIEIKESKTLMKWPSSL